MTVLAIFTGDSDKSQYEALREEVNWEREQPHGCVLHAASFDDSERIHVADVWESADAMHASVERRLMPAFQKLEIDPLEVAIYPLHNLHAYKSIKPYAI